MSITNCKDCLLITGVEYPGDCCRASVEVGVPLMLPDNSPASCDLDDDDNPIPGTDEQAVAVPGPLCLLNLYPYTDKEIKQLYENKL